MATIPVVRVVPAVFGRGNLENLEAAIRIIDPDSGDEFFSIGVQHVEALIASIRRSAGDAETFMTEIAGKSLEERHMLAKPVEGRA